MKKSFKPMFDFIEVNEGILASSNQCMVEAVACSWCYEGVAQCPTGFSCNSLQCGILNQILNCDEY